MILVCFMNAKFVKVAAAKSHELRIQHTRTFSVPIESERSSRFQF
ncbi:hypothetical protein J2R76_000170 [Bradyrhizobium sp. USDA 4532]|nr:hypothetical protein [Bradyrhizobium sp. USDA 4545]MCP1916579.1 hypothetical protein [Bradyrhizobium sp. USDA 4532]